MRLYREWAAPRPLLAGGMAAALVGVLAGFYFAPGTVWQPTPQKVAEVKPEPLPAPITPMVNDQGRTPDYVIGLDNLRRAPNPDEAVRVVGPPTPDRAAVREAVAEAGERHWWAPWSWGRPDEEDIRAEQMARLEEAREAAREARLAARERARERREEARLAARYDERYAAYDERYDDRYRTRYDERYADRDDERYDERYADRYIDPYGEPFRR